MIKIALFITGSGFLAYVSRASLRFPKSHGFPRFFAWEAILALILLNVNHWFEQPFSLRQIVSWILLFISIPIVITGLQSLKQKGKPNNQRDDEELLDLEKTTNLVTTGAYKYIRHPMYSSLLFLAWGVYLKDISWVSTGLVTIATILLVATAKLDEAECINYFGADYRGYMRHTRMFIPFLF